jgi:hypothetical protein
MPSRYGSYVTAWRRLKKLQEAGVWDKILYFFSSMRGREHVPVDSTTVEDKRGLRL